MDKKLTTEGCRKSITWIFFILILRFSLKLFVIFWTDLRKNRERLLIWVIKAIMGSDFIHNKQTEDEKATVTELLNNLNERLQVKSDPAYWASLNQFKQVTLMYENFSRATQFRTKMRRANELIDKINELDKFDIFTEHAAFMANFKNQLNILVQQRAVDVTKKGAKKHDVAQKDIEVIPRAWRLIDIYKNELDEIL